MNKPTILVTRMIDRQAISSLEKAADIILWTEPTPPPYEYLLEKASAIDGILSLLTDKINAQWINAASSRLKIISQMAVGYDNIDLSTATRYKIPVGHTPGVLTETTADLTFALLLAAARRIVEADAEVRQGIWRPWGPDILTGYDVNGSTLGIIGMGRIGQAVARRARGFNMRILYTDIQQNSSLEQEIDATYLPFNQLLAESDFITLHTYLSDQTRGLISLPQLKLMKKTAVLINTSRGPIVNPDDLYTALTTGLIASAGLDVFDPEPIPSNHPLLQLKNFIITPHIASASKKTRALMAKMAVENIIAALQGQKIPYCANPEVYK